MSGIFWLASYPKSGNTWLRAFLINLQQDAEHPADINALFTGGTAGSRDWLDAVLGFDTADLRADEIETLRPAVYAWERHSHRIGYHKIHDAYGQLADGAPLVSNAGTLGALYIVRNPLDIAISLARHNDQSIDATITRMGRTDHQLCPTGVGLRGQVPQHLSSWSGHVLSWLEAPGLNRLVIRYEDMLAEPNPTFTAAARFLQLPHDPARIDKAVRFSDFAELSGQEARDGFRERPRRARRFFRQGRSGAWRDHLSAAQVARIVADHGPVMRRLGYLDANDRPT
ncbi:MAG: sulfotransferase domain-containing protein [Gammaproteobacteria bacterium]